MTEAAHTLVLLRHGESEWNALNLFTGWVDVACRRRGGPRPPPAGRCSSSRVSCPTSCTPRCCAAPSRRRFLALDAADRHWIDVKRSWRLNERHYGALQGKDKKQTLAEFGEEQFMLWRRSYDTPPPPIELGSEFSQDADPRYGEQFGGPGGAAPRTECLADVVERMLPYWTESVVRTCRPARPSCSPRTGTPCAPS